MGPPPSLPPAVRVPLHVTSRSGAPSLFRRAAALPSRSSIAACAWEGGGAFAPAPSVPLQLRLPFAASPWWEGYFCRSLLGRRNARARERCGSRLDTEVRSGRTRNGVPRLARPAAPAEEERKGGAAMPSEDPPPPSRPSKPAQEKPSKPGSPSSEGPRAKPDKMVQGGDAGRKPRRPASEGEKDSGFSDGSSECLSAMEQTDAEEQAGRSPRQPAKSPRAPQKGPGGLPGSALPGLTPIYIVKNVILKQPLGAPAAPPVLAWSSQHPLGSGEGPPARLLLVQQPVAPLQGPLPGQKPPAKDACPPRLGSYPRIAPHPGHPPPAPQAGAAGPAPAAAAGKSKHFCQDEAWSGASNATAPAGGGNQSQKEASPAWGSPPAAGPPSLEALAQDAAASAGGWDLAEGRTLSRASRRLGRSSLGRQRRFQNTVEVLRRSGLLGITLRTKQLLRQNGGTRRELAELREHAQLLCEAVRSRDAQAWARLQQAVARSAAYWAARGAGLDAQPPGRPSPPAAEPPDPRLGAGRASSPRSLGSAPLLPEAPMPAGLL